MNQAAQNQRVIAVAEILTEVNSFSPVMTTRRDFEAGCLVYGAEILPYSRKEGWEIAGFLKAVDEFGRGNIEVAPLLKARCVPGGPVPVKARPPGGLPRYWRVWERKLL